MFFVCNFVTKEFGTNQIMGKTAQPRGVATDFWVVGSNRHRVANLPQNNLKIGKNTGFWPLHFRIWGGRPTRFSKVRGSRPPDPSPRRRRPWPNPQFSEIRKKKWTTLVRVSDWPSGNACVLVWMSFRNYQGQWRAWRQGQFCPCIQGCSFERSATRERC